MAAAGSVTELFLHDNHLHGIKADQITPVSSLKELHLVKCGIQSDDIGPDSSIVAAAGSVTALFLEDNDLHGIKSDQIEAVWSLVDFSAPEYANQWFRSFNTNGHALRNST